MKKMSTLFEKDPTDLGRVIDCVREENMWVYGKDVSPTRKFDGTACAIIEGELYKRYDSKINKKTGKRKTPPEGAIPCQEPDEITGHWPHWIKCDRNDRADKYHFEAFDTAAYTKDGTYELVGPKINGNNEMLNDHFLIPHGKRILPINDYSFISIKSFLSKENIEGIVFHHKDGRMCKIRKSDFGIKRI